jgi:hypothetical protein
MMKPIPILALAILIGSAVSTAWWWNSPSRFPIPMGLSTAPVNTMRALPPDAPSISSTPKIRAVPIPGLEDLVECMSPTLTADLKQIVFTMNRNAATGFDLYLATRASATERFSTPVCIQSTAGPAGELDPTLSPNGLELIFIRLDGPSELWYAQRPDLDSEFTAPTKWEISQVDDKTSRLGTPQFVTPNQVVFSRIDPEKNVRTIWSCQRASSESAFERPSLYAAPEGWPTLFFNADGQRGYYGGVEGSLLLLWRRSLESTFGPPDILTTAAATGPFNGTLWVSPKEDLVFYYSPGPGKKTGPSRLWMIGF